MSDMNATGNVSVDYRRSFLRSPTLPMELGLVCRCGSPAAFSVAVSVPLVWTSGSELFCLACMPLVNDLIEQAAIGDRRLVAVVRPWGVGADVRAGI